MEAAEELKHDTDSSGSIRIWPPLQQRALLAFQSANEFREFRAVASAISWPKEDLLFHSCHYTDENFVVVLLTFYTKMNHSSITQQSLEPYWFAIKLLERPQSYSFSQKFRQLFSSERLCRALSTHAITSCDVTAGKDLSVNNMGAPYRVSSVLTETKGQPPVLGKKYFTYGFVPGKCVGNVCFQSCCWRLQPPRLPTVFTF